MLRARIVSRIFALLLPFLGAFSWVLLQYSPLFPLSNSSVLINEVDAETPGTDTAEFVELFDGGSGHTSLDGLVVVFFNGQDDRSYRAFDLAGYQTNVDGYFILSNEAVSGVDLIFANNILQNGPDAIALYLGQADDFPNGTAVTSSNLQDALVYDSGDPDDPGLLTLLQSGEPQVDENGRDLAEFHSNQRCPDGGGGQRQTVSYIQDLPSPKSANNCPVVHDEAPYAINTSPSVNATDVAPNANITITFSEAVVVSGSWYSIACTLSGSHAATVSGDGTTFNLNPTTNFSYGENCAITLLAELVADVDTQDPPDQMVKNHNWSFSIEDPPAATQIIINEIDVDTPGSDTAEFIELYDGGSGATGLDGLVVVLFNGNGDISYRAIDLDGQQTDAQGYFVIGNAAVNHIDLIIPDSAIQNGADAIAIYHGNGSDFPSGTGVSTTNLLDAIVYDTDDEDDGGLLILLNSGQPQANEASRDNPTLDSNQRCPNGSGGQQNTNSFLNNLPTPGTANNCSFDSPPQLTETWPADGQQSIGQNISLTVTFNEAVQISADALALTCDSSGSHSLSISGGPVQFTFTPDSGFTAGEICTATVIAEKVSDKDSNDPPDHMVHDYTWSFSVRTVPVATELLINEVDADTAGTDTAEFIELFDGGSGRTKLDGLVIVLFNGYGDTSYRAIDLEGTSTDGSGYFVVGGSEVTGVDLVLPNGQIQNGADAVALYAAGSKDFPNGSPVTQNGLLDALVYDSNDEDDAGLLILLKNGQPQVNEAARDKNESDSNQRCPNGQGGQRNSSGYIQNPATPGSANDCRAAAVQFGDCGDPTTAIHLIQGSEPSSPLAGAQGVIVEGIVVGNFQGKDALDGFFLQEENEEQDGLPQTSEGIFIHDTGLEESVITGEIVRVQGTVAELENLTSMTDLIALRECGPGSAIDARSVTLPVPALQAWENMEGMLISIPQKLKVTGSAQLGYTGVVDLALKDRLVVPTETADPGEPALTLANLNSRSRIKLDDGSDQAEPLPLPPYLGPDNTLRIGDSVNELVGILSESGGGYHIQPTEPVILSRNNDRSSPPDPAKGILRAAVFDTDGYFNGDGYGSGFPGVQGAATAEEFTRQRTKIINAILATNADVTGLLSLENDGYGPDSAIQDLVNGLNDAAPIDTTYSFADPQIPRMGSSELAVGLIYNSDAVLPLETAVTTDLTPFNGPNVMPLIQAFAAIEDGESFVLTIAHFHHRDRCPAQGDPNDDQNDGQGCWNGLRVLAASTLAGLLETDPTSIEDTDILILGNLNAYTQEDPLKIFTAAGYRNLASRTIDRGYTTVVNGETGTALHALASPNLAAQVRKTIHWHVNADEPDALSYKKSNPLSLYAPDPFRSSQHDPVLVDMYLTPGQHAIGKVFLPILTVVFP